MAIDLNPSSKEMAGGSGHAIRYESVAGITLCCLQVLRLMIKIK